MSLVVENPVDVITLIKETFHASGKSMRGSGVTLCASITQQIEDALNSAEFDLYFDPTDAPSVIKTLARFEELRRRAGFADEFRPDRREIYRILIEDLAYNAICLETSPNNVSGATAYAPEAVGDVTWEEGFEAFLETPWVFRQAAVHNPSDPKKFLLSGARTTNGSI